MNCFIVYNINVWDIKWCNEFYAILDLPASVDNLKIKTKKETDTNTIFQLVVDELEKMYLTDKDNPVFIITAKIKINDYYYQIYTIEGI